MSGESQQETNPPPTGAGGQQRFRPYASTAHHVTKGRYITSNDPRGYIPVYEYPLNGQWIMMDIDDGYILWTGIWKALGNSKADIVKMLDSQPDLAPLIRRVRGGYLKIQGTWMPYEVALRLSRRVAWSIREDLIPLFGPTFPSTCLSPEQPGYGQIVASNGRRRPRRTIQASIPAAPSASWAVMSPTDGADHGTFSSAYPSPSGPSAHRFQLEIKASTDRNSHHPVSPGPRPNNRYSPYPGQPPATAPVHREESRRGLDSMNDLSLPSPGSAVERYERRMSDYNITLAPIRPLSPVIQGRKMSSSSSGSQWALPPITALEDLRGVSANDSAAVLRRLQEDDHGSYSEPDYHQHERWGRHRSSSAPNSHPSSSAPSPVSTSWSHPPPLLSGPPSRFSSIPSLGQNRLHHTQSSSNLSVSVSSSHSRYDSGSNCEPSPISPATPQSPLSIESTLWKRDGHEHYGGPPPSSHLKLPRVGVVSPEPEPRTFAYPPSVSRPVYDRGVYENDPSVFTSEREYHRH